MIHFLFWKGFDGLPGLKGEKGECSLDMKVTFFLLIHLFEITF